MRIKQLHLNVQLNYQATWQEVFKITSSLWQSNFNISTSQGFYNSDTCHYCSQHLLLSLCYFGQHLHNQSHLCPMTLCNIILMERTLPLSLNLAHFHKTCGKYHCFYCMGLSSKLIGRQLSCQPAHALKRPQILVITAASTFYYLNDSLGSNFSINSIQVQ